jgi:hypothetical protein
VIRMCVQIPAGSVTKTWTGVAVLQAVARGDLSLETPAHVWVDPPLLAQNKTSMSELWGRNPQVIHNMTLRGHLCVFVCVCVCVCVCV